MADHLLHLTREHANAGQCVVAHAPDEEAGTLEERRQQAAGDEPGHAACGGVGRGTDQEERAHQIRASGRKLHSHLTSHRMAGEEHGAEPATVHPPHERFAQFGNRQRADVVIAEAMARKLRQMNLHAWREPGREWDEIRGPDAVPMHENGCRCIDAPVPRNPGVKTQRPRTCDARDRGPLGPQPRQASPVLHELASDAQPEMERQETTSSQKCRTQGLHGVRRCNGHSSRSCSGGENGARKCSEMHFLRRPLQRLLGAG